MHLSNLRGASYDFPYSLWRDATFLPKFYNARFGSNLGSNTEQTKDSFDKFENPRSNTYRLELACILDASDPLKVVSLGKQFCTNLTANCCSAYEIHRASYHHIIC